MFTLRQLLIDALWVLGLAGLLATFSYMNWARTVRSGGWKTMFSLPRFLIPMCVSLELFCIGLAVNGAMAYQPAPWWETAAWSGFALIFAIQTIIYGWAGIQRGWDTPIEERDEYERAKRGR